ncbi:MAG: hypothetical protein U9O53_03875, partial [archaeon]|nr:hypothetical protein [archaeon]
TKERKTNPAYFFRTDIADVFKKTYEKEPDYLPLKEMFLKTLDNYADTLRQEGTRKVPVHYTAQIPAQNI